LFFGTFVKKKENIKDKCTKNHKKQRKNKKLEKTKNQKKDKKKCAHRQEHHWSVHLYDSSYFHIVSLMYLDLCYLLCVFLQLF
jgi:hypothetical protein